RALTAYLAAPPGPDPARDRLAAGLVGAEPGQQPGQVDDAGALVGRHDRTGSDVCPDLAERVELVRGVEQVGRQQPAGRTTHEQRLEVLRAARELDDGAQRGAEGALRHAVALRAADLDEDRARARLRADRRERLRAVDEDPRD